MRAELLKDTNYAVSLKGKRQISPYMTLEVIERMELTGSLDKITGEWMDKGDGESQLI